MQLLMSYILYTQMNQKSIRGCHRTLNQVQQKVEELQSTNSDLDKQLLELEVSLAERQQIERLAGWSCTILTHCYIRSTAYTLLYVL